MVRPRVFVSSTYYDLKHIRSSLENFIDSMGFETILSEKGNIAFMPDVPLDEACYREVENADIVIVIIGGRYGSERSEGKQHTTKQFYDRYESITKTEYVTAIKRNIPIYILVEKPVYADYETFLKNKTNEEINYGHVDSVNIFYLIDEILSQPKNNPIHQFDHYRDIEVWLKEQWAGLFRELINNRLKQVQIASLSYQINQLEEVNKTLKRYLEEIISKVSPNDSVKLIADESKRIEVAQQIKIIENNEFIRSINRGSIFSMENIRDAIITSESVEDFFEHLRLLSEKTDHPKKRRRIIMLESAKMQIDEIRMALGYSPLDIKGEKRIVVLNIP